MSISQNQEIKFLPFGPLAKRLLSLWQQHQGQPKVLSTLGQDPEYSPILEHLVSFILDRGVGVMAIMIGHNLLHPDDKQYPHEFLDLYQEKQRSEVLSLFEKAADQNLVVRGQIEKWDSRQDKALQYHFVSLPIYDDDFNVKRFISMAEPVEDFDQEAARARRSEDGNEDDKFSLLSSDVLHALGVLNKGAM